MNVAPTIHQVRSRPSMSVTPYESEPFPSSSSGPGEEAGVDMNDILPQLPAERPQPTRPTDVIVAAREGQKIV
jgi:hypothetical protein